MKINWIKIKFGENCLAWNICINDIETHKYVIKYYVEGNKSDYLITYFYKFEGVEEYSGNNVLEDIQHIPLRQYYIEKVLI